MRENVGGEDRLARALLGPTLVALGYARWGGHRGAPAGLLAMMAGAVITETAITRVCPLNEALGIDTAPRPRLPMGVRHRYDLTGPAHAAHG